MRKIVLSLQYTGAEPNFIRRDDLPNEAESRIEAGPLPTFSMQNNNTFAPSLS